MICVSQELTPHIEKQFFETLSKLKQNDPEIYDPGKRFFNERQGEEGPAKNKKKSKEKPMFLRDYEREMLLNGEGVQTENGKITCLHYHFMNMKQWLTWGG